jgi:MoaA/NifB/PqqE/SkfB family radical SAM enzyme
VSTIRTWQNRRRIPPLSEIGWTYAKYNWLQPLVNRPFLPTTLVFYVTYRCNSRCTMCGIWRRQRFDDAARELSPKELDQILADRLFPNIQHLNINGGEPTLRGDLVDLVQVAIDRLPRLRWITMSSNGLLAERLVSLTDRIGRICTEEKISFSLAISLHGVAEVSDRITGIERAFDRQIETLAALQQAAFGDRHRLSLHCVITAANAGDLGELLRWSRGRKLPISFALAEVRERFLNLDKADQVRISAGQMDQVIAFLRELSHAKALFNPSAFRYHHLANILQLGQKRTMACHYAMGGVILGARGELYYCPHSRTLGTCRTQPAYDIYYAGENLSYRRSELIHGECLRCPPYTFNRLEYAKDLKKYLRFLLIPQRGD